jgi:hypothetical protein
MRLKTIIITVVLWNIGASAACAGISVMGELTREKTVTVGKTYEGTILISNRGKTTQTARVYQNDYLFYADGTNVYGDPGTDPRSNAKWITYTPHSAEIPAQSSAEIHYTITVPDDLGLTGTYWSMLMVEGVNPDQQAVPEGNSKMALNQLVRYAVQIVTHIGASGEKKLEFKKAKLVRNAGKRMLEEDLENTGERWLTPVLWVELYDRSGVLTGRFPGGNSRIYPQTSARFRVDLSSVKEGDYKALIVADCGGEDVYGISSKLKISDVEEAVSKAQPAPVSVSAPAPAPAPAPVQAPAPASVPQPRALPQAMPIPWAFIGVTVVVLLAIMQRKRIGMVIDGAVTAFRAAPAAQAPVPEPVSEPVLAHVNTSAIDVFDAVNTLVDDAHLLALNSEAIAARVSARQETVGDYREELKALIMAAIDSLDFTVLFIEGYLNQDKSERVHGGQYQQVMQTVIENYNKVADTMSFVAQATQLINQPIDKAVSQKQLSSQADALRDMAGKLKQVVGVG